MVASDIVKLLKKNSKIALIAHIMPDGDTLGSTLALGLALKQDNKDVICLCADPVPPSYIFLPGADLINRHDKIADIANIAVAVAIDSSDRERLGICDDVFAKASHTINIDHHISNKNFAEYNMVDTTAAATAELIYQLLKLAGVTINKEIATCLYTGIVTDTGRFSYDNTTSITHEIAGDLINCGVNTSWVNDEIFNKIPLKKAHLLAKALETIKVCENGAVAFMRVDLSMLEAVKADDADCDGFVNYARDIDTAEVGLLFKEMKDGHVKVSLRSKNYVDVNAIAAKFGGGGHKRAAGCALKASMDDAIEMVLNEVKLAIKLGG